jgi:hypothetical protein
MDLQIENIILTSEKSLIYRSSFLISPVSIKLCVSEKQKMSPLCPPCLHYKKELCVSVRIRQEEMANSIINMPDRSRQIRDLLLNNLYKIDNKKLSGIHHPKKRGRTKK